MYRVIVPFFDLQDGGHAYHLGDTFPRPGKKAGQERIAALLSTANRRRMPLIEVVKEDKAVDDGQSGDFEPVKRQSRKTKQRK